VRGCWLRDLYINPLTTLFLVQKLFVNREKFIHKEIFHLGGVEMGVFFLGLHKLWGRFWLLVLSLSLWGTSFISDLGGFLWGWREKK
jgi:hypothetical protein